MAKKEDKKITVIDANVEGREKAIAEAIRQIDKKYGEGAIMRLGSAPLKEVDVIPTGALCIDIALGIGGIPRGRVTEIYGPESSGKNTVSLHIIAEAQKRGGEVFYARPEFCTDNGAMIAYAGMVRLQTGAKAELGVTVRPRWPLAELPAA